MKHLFTMLFAIVAFLMASCGSTESKASSDDTNNLDSKTEKKSLGSLSIDTVYIHGKPHEILFWDYYKIGGMIHSPECWCHSFAEDTNVAQEKYVAGSDTVKFAPNASSYTVNTNKDKPLTEKEVLSIIEEYLRTTSENGGSGTKVVSKNGKEIMELTLLDKDDAIE